MVKLLWCRIFDFSLWARWGLRRNRWIWLTFTAGVTTGLYWMEHWFLIRRTRFQLTTHSVPGVASWSILMCTTAWLRLNPSMTWRRILGTSRCCGGFMVMMYSRLRTRHRPRFWGLNGQGVQSSMALSRFIYFLAFTFVDWTFGKLLSLITIGDLNILRKFFCFSLCLNWTRPNFVISNFAGLKWAFGLFS